MKHGSAILITLCVLCGDATADTPLPPPEKHTACSPAGNICAMSDPVSKRTIVSAQQPEKKLWTIPGWHRWLLVSNDGESVVVGYAGVNLVPTDATLKEPVFSFYHRGKPIRIVTLGDLYQRKAQMRLTASHYAWTQGAGFNKANQLIVELIDGRTIAFAAKTGRMQRPDPDGRQGMSTRDIKQPRHP